MAGWEFARLRRPPLGLRAGSWRWCVGRGFGRIVESDRTDPSFALDVKAEDVVSAEPARQLADLCSALVDVCSRAPHDRNHLSVGVGWRNVRRCQHGAVRLARRKWRGEWSHVGALAGKATRG
jgi:hypothetical protein